MAETVLIGVVKSVLEKLSDPTLKEFLLLWNVDKDLKRLRLTIETISDVLYDAEQKESRELAVKGWLSRLRTVLYDADDLFDAVAYMAMRKKVMSGNAFKKEVRQFFSKSNQLVFIYKMAHGIRDIREALDDIEKDRKPFGFKLLSVREERLGVIFREETHSFVDINKVIGRDDDKENIIDLLLANDREKEGNCGRNFSVVSVIGFGGLGKTTLAQLVYGDERVKKNFDLCLWVCINYFSDLKSVLMAILATSEGSSLDELQGRLRKKIRGKKFLLVLDDVWDEDASNWGELENLLDCGKSGSMVLVTTRKATVARCLDAMKPYYELSVLSEESACSLFVKMAFKDGELSSDSDLVSLVQQIVRKCGYVPLALVTIGRMLRSKEKDSRIWLSFVEKELPEVLSGHMDKNKLLQVLKVSYNDLPSAIKHCFAYCSLFPKDYEFDKDELVRLWLAQGFVEKHPIRSLEEVGDNYFFYMVDRCFFQEVKSFTFKDIKYLHLQELNVCPAYKCKMHDLLHDLAIQVAGKENKRYDGKYSREEIESNTFRHISINPNSNFSFDDSFLSLHPKTLRTIIVHGIIILKTDYMNSILVAFKTLRVLKLSLLLFDELPDSFEELIHLRYLDISNNWHLKVLPDSICKLHHLQTLDLRKCVSLVKLPSKLGRLVSLRHLFVYGCSKLDYLRSELASLTSLVTLDQVIVHSFDGNLRYLGDLHKLSGIVRVELPEKGWENCIDDARKSNMSRKEKLYGMILNKRRPTGTLRVEPPIEMSKEETKAILEALQPHVNLQYLNITGFGSDTLSNWFSSLSNLKELILDDIKTLEYLDPNGVTSCSIFKSLRFLKLKSLPKLKGWWREVASTKDDTTMAILPCLPNISKVVIENCPNLIETMPSFGGVQNLKLHGVNGKMVSEFINVSTLNKVEEITIIKVEDLWCLPEGSIKHWTALKSLNIRLCSGLDWISCCGLAYLTALEELVIRHCGDVILKDEDDVKVGKNGGLGMPWKNLQSLGKLHVPWQGQLQGGLQYLTSLENLTLQYDRNEQVEADNRGMEVRGKTWEGLTRLQTLTIKFCSEETF